MKPWEEVPRGVCNVEDLKPGDLIWLDQSDRGWEIVDRVVDCTADPIAPVFFVQLHGRSMAVYRGHSFLHKAAADRDSFD
jgi:hypothetical protein